MSYVQIRCSHIPNCSTAIWAVLRLLQPLFDTSITENMLALGETAWCLSMALWGLIAKVVVAYDAS
jgi:hypothetical protein